uniref:Phytanoyl-CoA dioxygenase n=1 Tax=Guillardia theta (strain CCMP2712) TaxID=905079 RepID=A0A0C3TBY8_GUITC
MNLKVLPGFASQDEVKEMKGRMQQLIDQWDPEEARGSVFHTYGNDKLNQEYFLGSASTVRFFLEAEAVKDTGVVKPFNNKASIINKVGHGLHFIDPVFRQYAQSDKVKALVKSLGYKDPVLPQSMYIFKQAKIGGEVTSHQDSTYLFTEPVQTCLGLWLALDEADELNGCLWARKGSHRHEEAKKWVGKVPGGNPHYSQETVEALKKAGFVSLPVKAGDLVCFAGTLDHLSLSNRTERERHTFQLHLVEGPAAGVKWASSNWMQYPEGNTGSL